MPPASYYSVVPSTDVNKGNENHSAWWFLCSVALISAVLTVFLAELTQSSLSLTSMRYQTLSHLPSVAQLPTRSLRLKAQGKEVVEAADVLGSEWPAEAQFVNPQKLAHPHPHHDEAAVGVEEVIETDWPLEAQFVDPKKLAHPHHQPHPADEAAVGVEEVIETDWPLEAQFVDPKKLAHPHHQSHPAEKAAVGVEEVIETDWPIEAQFVDPKKLAHPHHQSHPADAGGSPTAVFLIGLALVPAVALLAVTGRRGPQHGELHGVLEDQDEYRLPASHHTFHPITPASGLSLATKFQLDDPEVDLDLALWRAAHPFPTKPKGSI